MSKERSYWVYILASKIGGTLYIGVTNDLVRRVYEHQEGLAEGFTTKASGFIGLVYFEQHTDIEAAIRREKRLKKWNRAVENPIDRGKQSKLERPVSRHASP